MELSTDDIKGAYKDELSRTGDRTGIEFARMEYRYHGAWDYIMDNY